MTDTALASETETQMIRLDWDMIDRRCTELGATTGADRAELLGAGRAQLYRWRDGTNDIGLNRAASLAARIGLTLADIVADKAPPESGKPTGPPKQPDRPNGPKTDPPPTKKVADQ